MPLGTEFDFTALPSEVVASPAASQPESDIETHFNKLLRAIKELMACINGGTAGTDSNGTPLENYTGLGILERLTAIEDSGNIQDSDKLQIGGDLSTGDRYMRFILGALTTYAELFYDESESEFSFRNQAGAKLRVKGATPTDTDDFGTKGYIDGLLGGGIFAKACWVGTPTKTGNKTFTIDYIYANDSTGTQAISKSTITTIDMATLGKNGLLASGASKGISGTISVTNGSPTVTGVGTTFLTDFQAGDWIVTAGAAARKILSVTNNLTMTTTSNFSGTESGVAYSRGGVTPTSAWELNLYSFSNGVDACFGMSTRNALGGDTLVDVPRDLKTGTAAITSGSPTVTGTGTLFLSEYQAGQQIMFISGSTSAWYTILSIESNTSLTLSTNAGVTLASASVYLNYIYYRQLPFSPLLDGSGNQYDYLVTGFPFATKILLRNVSTTVVSGHTSASNTSKNLISNGIVPDLTNAVDIQAYAISVSNATIPSLFYVGSFSGDTFRFAKPWEYLYNSGANSATGTGMVAFSDVPMDTSDQLWYKSDTTNCQGGVSVIGVTLGKWY